MTCDVNLLNRHARFLKKSPFKGIYHRPLYKRNHQRFLPCLPLMCPPARFREPINIQACGDPYCVGVSGAGWRAPFPLRGCFIIWKKVLAFKRTPVSISHPLIILTASVTLKNVCCAWLKRLFFEKITSCKNKSCSASHFFLGAGIFSHAHTLLNERVRAPF